MRRFAFLTLLSCSACAPLLDSDGEGDPAAGSTTEASSDTTPNGTGGPVDTTTPVPEPPPMTTDPFDPTTGGGSSGGADDTGGCAFLCDTSETSSWIECDLFEQDCPEGEKCNPWANDGGSSWNALKCVPVDPEPDDIDEPCTVEGSGVSGLDSCVVGAMCWGVDAETGVGYCVPHCTGSDDAPTCADPSRQCSIAGDGVLALCLPQCDPLDVRSCPAAQGCYSTGSGFLCAPDASGPKAGGLFEACEYVNACNPGLSCAQPHSACEPGSSGCCTPWCNLQAPDCPEMTACIPFFGEGESPPGYETLGLCLGEDG